MDYMWRKCDICDFFKETVSWIDHKSGKATRLLSWPWVQLDQAFPDGQNRRLSPIVNLELMKNIADVILYCLLTEIQAVGNFLVGLPVRNQPQDRDFSFRQVMLHPGRLLSLLLGHERKLCEDFAGDGRMDQRLASVNRANGGDNLRGF